MSNVNLKRQEKQTPNTFLYDIPRQTPHKRKKVCRQNYFKLLS